MNHVYRVTAELANGRTVWPLVAAPSKDDAAAKAQGMELFASRIATVRAVVLEDEPRDYRRGR